MKSDYEKIINNPYVSWSFLHRVMQDEIPFQWHHHPEYELTFTLNSYGVKYIGGDVDHYKDNDLVLIGPNIPHSWKSQGKINDNEPHLALVIWFSSEWIEKLADTFPEMKAVKDFLRRINTAVTFSSEIIQQVRPDIIAIADLSPPYRTPLLLNILLQLASDSVSEFSSIIYPESFREDRKQVRNILEVIDYLNNNYHQRISVEQMATMCHVSPTTFHRLFKRITKKSPVDYMINLRIMHAAEKLLESQDSVSSIADDVGYSSLALFNRHFKASRGMSPREFRDTYLKNR